MGVWFVGWVDGWISVNFLIDFGYRGKVGPKALSGLFSPFGVGSSSCASLFRIEYSW